MLINALYQVEEDFSILNTFIVFVIKKLLDFVKSIFLHQLRR